MYTIMFVSQLKKQVKKNKPDDYLVCCACP